jgi:hypothetical protein
MLPATTFLAFYLMHYGPHTLVPDWLRMTDGYSDLAHDRYAMGILFSNFGLSVGMFFSRGLFNIPLGQKTFEDLTTRGAEAGRALLGSRALLFAAFAYALVFAALDGPTLPRTSEYLRYFFSDSIFSYDELRREVFSGSPLEILGQYTRQSTSAILLALCALSVFYTRGLTRLYFLVACIVVFILCSMQLNKFPVPYTLITVFIALYVFRRPRPTIDRKGVTTGIIILVVAALLVQTLYFIQYRDPVLQDHADAGRCAEDVVRRIPGHNALHRPVVVPAGGRTDRCALPQRPGLHPAGLYARVQYHLHGWVHWVWLRVLWIRRNSPLRRNRG